MLAEVGRRVASRERSSQSLDARVGGPPDPQQQRRQTFMDVEEHLAHRVDARAKGRLKGRQPKLTIKQQTELRRMHGTGDYTTVTDLAELFKVSPGSFVPGDAILNSTPSNPGV